MNFMPALLDADCSRSGLCVRGRHAKDYSRSTFRQERNFELPMYFTLGFCQRSRSLLALHLKRT